MSTPGLIPAVASGNQSNIARSVNGRNTPTLGNTAGVNAPGIPNVPTGTPVGGPGGIIPGQRSLNGKPLPTLPGAATTGAIPGVGAMPGTSTPTTPINSPKTISGTNLPGKPMAMDSSSSGTGGLLDLSSKDSKNLEKQWIDIYGKGTGSLLFNLVSGMGSQNNQWLEAYKKAMDQPNAENMATLQTSLANAGLGANSSAYAIAMGDFQAGITAQEGQYMAQMQQQELQNIIGLTQGTQESAQKETSSSWLSTLGSVLAGVGNFVTGNEIKGPSGGGGGQSIPSGQASGGLQGDTGIIGDSSPGEQLMYNSMNGGPAIPTEDPTVTALI